MVTAKMKKLSGPEISSFQGEAAVLDHPPVLSNNGDCKDEEAEWAGDQQLQGQVAVLDHPPVQSNNGIVWWLNR